MIDKNKISIAFIADVNVFEGLCIALFSVLKKSTAEEHKVYLFNVNLLSEHIDILNKVINPFKNKIHLEIIKIQPPKTKNSLHGNTSTFLKLKIGEYVKEPRLIYLDVDLVVNIDIKQLWLLDLEGNAIGAVKECTIFETNEVSFFEKYSDMGNCDYFNAGVLLIDVYKWNEIIVEEIYNKIIDSSLIHTADQAILNLLFFEKVKYLDSRFNFLLHKKLNLKKSEYDKNSIFHFIGMPKPWHPLMNLVGNSYFIYGGIKKQIPVLEQKSSPSISDLKFIKKFIKQYIRMLLKF